MTLLSVEGLKTTFHVEVGGRPVEVRAVDDVSFSLEPGEILGVVGESGSGKSVTSLSIMRLLPPAVARHPGGRIALLGKDLLTLSSTEMTRLRGRDVAMIFQEPMTSLNPVFRVGAQVAEAIRTHEQVSEEEARRRTLDLFEEVGIPDPAASVEKYPHEMSGGQKQRVMIAMALSCNPRLLIADEPTTALDVTIQAQILELLRDLRDRRGMAILFITHDLGVVGELADKVAVMFRGRLVEYGDVLSIFENPQHPYTKGLLACRPTLESPYTVLPTVSDFMDVDEVDGALVITERALDEARVAELQSADAVRRDPDAPVVLEVRDLSVRFPTQRDLLGRVTKEFTAVDSVGFTVRKGHTLGLVGESGCGKTTTGRAILRLVEPAAGTVQLDGDDLSFMAREPASERTKAVRRKLQIIFQDPYSSLDPRQTVEQILTEPMIVHGLVGDKAARRARAAALLDEVDLPAAHLRRYPHEFSGGQRQRICIARALAVEPTVIVCDESVSALDVSVQAQVLNLLRRLQLDRGLTYLFISHDLSVVKFMSDEICVMKDGRIVEAGPAQAIYAAPQHPYTQKLIAAIPHGTVEGIRARRAAAPQA
ncbi:MAG: ABC transporter ATP-binding protein [Alphaproteobacteria bacterium]|nr:ABC transporter ATP-binding protein [Alphaproteobacteria bacterium]